jgi:hypothetical protein
VVVVTVREGWPPFEAWQAERQRAYWARRTIVLPASFTRAVSASYAQALEQLQPIIVQMTFTMEHVSRQLVDLFCGWQTPYVRSTLSSRNPTAKHPRPWVVTKRRALS